MAVARRAETYTESAHGVFSGVRARETRMTLSCELEVGERSRHTDARLEAGLVDVVDGGAQASGLGFMRPSYFASCEPVIPGRAPIYGPAVSRLRH